MTKNNKKKVILTVFIIFCLLILGVMGYLFLTGSKLKENDYFNYVAYGLIAVTVILILIVIFTKKNPSDKEDKSTKPIVEETKDEANNVCICSEATPSQRSEQVEEIIEDSNENAILASSDEISENQNSEESNETQSMKFEAKTLREKIADIDPEVLQKYSILKNTLLSYKGATCKFTKTTENFRANGAFAKIYFTAKSLKFYLPLDANKEELARYHLTDCSDKKKFVAVPAMTRVRSDLSLRKALALLEMVVQEKGLEKDPDYKEQDFTDIETNFPEE